MTNTMPPLANDMYAGYRARVASQLEENSEVCWVSVVCFVADGDAEVFDEEASSKPCQLESKTNPHKQCYCGRWQNGKMTAGAEANA